MQTPPRAKYMLACAFTLFVLSASFAQKTVWQVCVQTPGPCIPIRIETEGNFPYKTITLINGVERIPLIAASSSADSALYPLHIFDGALLLVKSATPTGYYIRYNTKGIGQRMPITMRPERQLYGKSMAPGRYDVTFTEPNGSKPYKAVGLLSVQNGRSTGSFETSTGDYRFLEGELAEDSLWLSCLDGGHLFLFTTRLKGDSLIHGRFWSGGKSPEHWNAVKNEKARLPEATANAKATTDAPVDVSVIDVSGKVMHLSDPRFVGKALILQVMGTWCPNCMDETNWLRSYYATKPANLEIVGLAFERKADPAFWRARIERVTKLQQVPYPIGFAGIANRDSASAKLPFISGVPAFPTTIFLDRKHRVTSVHTGFSGPATGNDYELYKKEFARLVEEALAH